MPDEDRVRRSDEIQAPTLRELAMVLFRHRTVFACVSGLVLLASVLYACFGTKYEARMKVLVRRGRANAPVTAQENAPLDLTRMVITEEELNSEVELLRDNEVLRKTVQETRAESHDLFHFLRFGEGNPERIERAARRLARNLQVEPVKKTNLITVKYAAADPQTAAIVLQSVANAYLEKHMAVHRPAGELQFFERQIVESQRQLEESKQKLLHFASTHGVVQAAQQRDLALQRLSEVDASYRQTQIALAETSRRVTELEQELESLPERTTTQVRTADNPELLKSLKSSLLELQLKRTDLLTKFEPGHPLVLEVERQISQAEAAIVSENSLPVRDETTDKNSHYEWANSELQAAQVQLKSLQAREAATRQQRFAYETWARHLGEDAVTQDDLLSSEKAAEENYLLYVKKQEEARMDDALDETGIVNVAIAEHPIAPALPVRSAWLVLAIGVVLAGSSGVGASFAADRIDCTFRTPEEVVDYLNCPVLASLPAGARKSLSA